MNENDRSSQDCDVPGKTAALRRAAVRALELGRKTGTPVWVMQDGKLVNLLADEQRPAERNGGPTSD